MKKSIGELINLGTNILKDNNVDTARLDAELLLGKVLDKERIYLITHREESVIVSNEKEYLKLIDKRKDKMPVKYILNECEFMGLNLYIEEGVLIPRGDTEILVEEVLNNINEDEEKEICDLCCGSGAIGISLAYFRSKINVDLIDYYEITEKVTLINIERFNLKDRTSFIRINLLEEVILQEKQ